MAQFLLDENLTVEDVTLADVRIQKIYLERQRVYMVAQAATYMFFLFIFAGMVGLIQNWFNMTEFLLMLLMGIAVLFIASYPYMQSLRHENEFLNHLEGKIKSSSKGNKMKISRRHLKS